MWKTKIRKKKLQFSVMALILLCATLILSTCLCFRSEVDQFTNQVFDAKENAQVLLTATKGMTDQIKKSGAKDIKKTSKFSCYPIKTLSLTHKGNRVQDYIDPLYALVTEDYKKLPFGLSPIDGDKASKAPASGQVWVQNIVADNHGIQVGDTFTLKANGKTKEFKVTTLVNDTRKPVSMTSGACIFINQSDASWFQSEQEMEYIGIYTDSKVQDVEDWLSGISTKDIRIIDSSTLSGNKQKAGLLTLLVGGLGSISAAVMFLITLVIVLFFIRSTILSEYSAIGTYKSVGFTTKQIIGFYQKAYSLVGISAIVAGSLLGLPLSKILGNIIMEYIGDYSMGSASLISVGIVALVTSLLLTGCVFMSLRRIRRITPIDAFQTGVTSSRAKLKRSLIPRAHSSFAMAINDIFKHKGKSALIILVITLTFYIGTLLMNMCLSFDHMEDNAPAWVSQPACDCFVTNENGDISDATRNEIERNSMVDSTLLGALYSKVNIESNENDLDTKYTTITCFDTFDSSKTGIHYETGRAPENPDEIAIDSTSLAGSSLTIGDTVILTIGGKKHSYLLTGIYNSMMSPSMAMVTDSFKDLDGSLYRYQLGVNLKDPEKLDNFKAYIKEHYPDLKIVEMKDYVDDIKISIMSIMIPITLIIITVFFVFTLLNITNLVLTNNKEMQSAFGVMKAYGFTSGYILRRVLWKIGLLTIVGMVLSQIGDAIVNGPMYQSILSVDAYRTVYPATLYLLGGGFLIVILITLLISLSIRKISPRDLMEE